MYEIVRYVKANDLGPAVLLEEMIKRPGQFRKMIVASSMSIYGEGAYRLGSHDWEFRCNKCGDLLASIGTPEEKPLFPTSVYAVSKQDQEQYSLAIGRAYKIPTVAFRYFNVYGTRQALSNPYTGVCAIFSSRLLNDQPPTIFEDGEQSRDFVHVSDIVNANLLALDSDGGDYEAMNVGTGRPTTVKQIAETLARGLGKKIEPEIVGKYREGDIRHCVADISKARRLIGYQPRVSLESGMEELLGWVSRQEAADKVGAATAELVAQGLVK
jgi:dTDP-L-rhamnose 4-epimerase